jgi:protein TonB
MDIQQRDATYRRRLTVVSTIVIATASIVVVVMAPRLARRESSKWVGWKGELELLPEITIEPDIVAPQAAPAPRPEPAPANIAQDVADHSEFETTPPAPAEAPRESPPDIIDPDARGAALSEATRSHAPASYSDTYVILRMVKPKYPPREQADGIEGNVTVELLVDEVGRVAEAYVVSLVGPKSFETSALDAVRQFEFQPPVEDGRPSSMWIKFVIKFRML